MPKVLFGSRLFQLANFENEAELERAVVKFSNAIFGDKTVYFDVKREVRKKRTR